MDITEVLFHTRSLKRRMNKLKTSINESIGEENIDVRTLDIEQISHDLYMVKVQSQRLGRFIDK